MQQLSDGGVLFRLNCARCHTKNWSFRVNEPARTGIPPLAPAGSGAYGPSLRGGSVLLQFPGRAGEQEQFDWVALGVPANDLYGVAGHLVGPDAAFQQGAHGSTDHGDRRVRAEPVMPSSVLAAEFFEKNSWYPTILGFLVVFSAILLFCGSIYALLGTNLGARLGFLVAFTGLMAFMVVLTSLWMITASPLNTLKGRIPSWKVQQIVTDPAKARATEVRNIENDGRRVGAIEAAAVKAAVDEHLVMKKEIKAEGPLEEDANEFARFDDVTLLQGR